MFSKRTAIQPYLTKDGSVIRELFHPSIHGNQYQSLAEATVPAGVTTHLHRHVITEEIYYILSGRGIMRLGIEEFLVEAGDTICIRPGTAHCIKTISADPLIFLCCCAPAYRHEDTELLEVSMANN